VSEPSAEPAADAAAEAASAVKTLLVVARLPDVDPLLADACFRWLLRRVLVLRFFAIMSTTVWVKRFREDPATLSAPSCPALGLLLKKQR
jgi:hypothetical protein